MVIHYLWEAQRLFYWQVQDVFLKDFLAYAAVVESVSLQWASDFGLKTQNAYHGDTIIQIAYIFLLEAPPLG